jgi:hypothetical protein
MTYTTTNTTPSKITVNPNPPPLLINSKSTSTLSTTDITKATKGGKKAKKTKKQNGGTITIIAPANPSLTRSNLPGPSTHVVNAQNHSQSVEYGRNDPGAKSPLWNQQATSSTTTGTTATTGGGRRRKSRKYRKTRKSRKSRKSRRHKRRNTYKK